MTGRLFREWLAVAFLSLLPQIGTAQEPNTPGTIPPDGTEIFRSLLATSHLEPVTEDDLRLRRVPLHNVATIILGDATRPTVLGETPLTWAGKVIAEGGAILIASDSHLSLEPLFPLSNITVAGEKVHGTDPRTLYNGWANCPFVVPHLRPEPRPGEYYPEYDIFEGLRVATNAPSYLRVPVRGNWYGSVLATFPRGCRTADGWNLEADAVPFAIGGSRFVEMENRRFFRFLAIADPSVFLNQMMVPLTPDAPPPDNLRFATRCIAFLTHSRNKPVRNRCLFIQDGQIVTDFQVLHSLLRPLPPLPSMSQVQDHLVELADRALDRAEEHDLFNRAMLGLEPDQRNRRWRTIVSRMLALGCLWAALMIVRKVWRNRQSFSGPAPQAGGRPRLPMNRPAGAVFDRRQRELLDRDNLSEPAGIAARSLFTAAGAPAGAGSRLPPVVVAETVRRPGTLRQALAELWTIGYGPLRPVTVQEWERLEPLAERLRQAHAAGKWRFVIGAEEEKQA